MPVSSTADRTVFNGDGSTTAFVTSFKFLSSAHLAVTVNGVVKALTTDYTVSGGDPTGTVTFVVAPATGTGNVVVYRSVPLTRSTDYVENDPLLAATLDQDFDLIVMMMQQVAARLGSTAFDVTATAALMSGTDTAWDAESKRISSLATPTSATDAVTKAYVDAIAAAAGNVPTPANPGDDDKVLTASGGTYTWVAPISGSGVPTPMAGDSDKRLRVKATEDGYELRTLAQEKTSFGFGTAAFLDVGTTALKVVQLDAAAKLPAHDGSQLTNIAGLLSLAKLVVLQDQKASGTAGGTFTQGAWQTRVLNTEVNDTGNLCTLAANQFTLSAGDYIVFASAQGVAVGDHRLRIRNTTAGTTLVEGNNAHASDKAAPAVLVGPFTVAAAQVLELQHRCESTRSTDGYGQALSTGDVERYSTVFLLKIG